MSHNKGTYIFTVHFHDPMKAIGANIHDDIRNALIYSLPNREISASNQTIFCAYIKGKTNPGVLKNIAKIIKKRHENAIANIEIAKLVFSSEKDNGRTTS